MLSPTAQSRTSTSPRHSPQPGERRGQGQGSKRKRKTLSCYECRRRKLKCDREEPACGRCRKGGHPETCSYVYDVLGMTPRRSAAPVSSTGDSANHNHGYNPSSPPKVASQFLDINGEETPPSSLQAPKNRGTWQLLGQMSTAEARLAVAADADDTDSGDWATNPRAFSMPKEAVIFRGENFRTGYFGGSNATSAIAHFPELRAFMKETIRNQTALPRVQRDMKALRVRWKNIKNDLDLGHLTHEDLLKLLPDRDTADRHVRLYFDTVETTYRIVHYQTFYEQYELLWESPHEVNSASVVILLLVMASVSCLFPYEQPKYIGDSSLFREKATFYIQVAEKWLSRQSQKHIYLAVWQIRCLIVLAKYINVVKKKRIWTEIGTLMREAMSCGFHRDPSLLGDKVSFFDQEMRRRLWATIIELELHISIDRGMPSASAGLPSDTANVLNVHDSELEKDGRPKSRPFEEHTSTSYLHISRSSFSLRVSLNSLVNDLISPLLYEQVLNYEDVITKELRKLPPVIENQGSQRNINGMSLTARTLLDVQLRQFLIMLHAPFARQAETSSRFSLSRMAVLSAAAEILKQYSYMNKFGNLFPLMFRNDPFRIALMICQTTFVNITIQNNLILNSNSTMLIGYVEEALTMLEQRITQHGTGYTFYWYISAASALLRAILAPEEAVTEKEEAIGRVTTQYYRILAGQEELFKARETIFTIPLTNGHTTEHPLLPNELNNTTGLSILPTDDPQDVQMDIPLDQFFFGNPAAWTFENLWTID